MIVFKSIGAVIVGFMAIVVLVLTTTPLVVRLMLKDPSQPPTAAYLTVNLLLGFAFAVVGGWIAAHLAPVVPFWHAVALAVGVLVLGVATAAQGGAVRAGQPQWYAWMLPFIGATGAVFGGLW
jgi:hypothetical protein